MNESGGRVETAGADAAYMRAIDELRKMARDLYARARASHNPFTKRKLIKLADDYLLEAEVMRHNKVGGAK
jgi:hypothetical protein